MRREIWSILRAAMVFGVAAGVCSFAMTFVSNQGDPRQVMREHLFWEMVVLLPMALAAIIGGTAWAIIVRLTQKPRWGTGALAGLLTVMASYAVHIVAMALLLVDRGNFPDRPHGGEGWLVIAFVWIYAMSTIFFVPGFFATGAILGSFEHRLVYRRAQDQHLDDGWSASAPQRRSPGNA